VQAAEPDAEPEQAAPAAAASAGVLVPAPAEDYDHLLPHKSGLPCWSRDLPPLAVMRRPANSIGVGIGWLKEPSHPRYNACNPGIWATVKRLTPVSPFHAHGFTHMCVKIGAGGLPCGVTLRLRLTDASRKSAFITVDSSKAAFSNTEAQRHDADCHRNDGKASKRKAINQEIDTAACVLAGIPDTAANALTKDVAESIMATFMAPTVLRKAKSKSKRQMAMQMLWFCFSRQYDCISQDI